MGIFGDAGRWLGKAFGMDEKEAAQSSYRASGERAQAASLDRQHTDQIRQQQMGLGQTLSQAAAGQGPSAARGVLNQGLGANIAAANAAAQGQAGGNMALAARNANYGRAAAIGQAANDAAMLRAREQQAAMGLASQHLAGMRGADYSEAALDAQMRQQAALANQQSAMQAHQINAGTAAGNAGHANAMYMDQANRAQGGLLGVAGMITGAATAGAGGGAGGGTPSGAQWKTGIKPAEQEASEFLQALDAAHARAGQDTGPRGMMANISPKKFSYTPEAQGKLGVPGGQRLGVVAEDVEKAGPMGKAIVKTGPDGVKRLDGDQTLGALLAAVSAQEKEIQKLKGANYPTPAQPDTQALDGSYGRWVEDL